LDLRNIATVGHIDAGKTSLTEKLLAYGTNVSGSVKAGTTRTDLGVVERKRGITIHTLPASATPKDFNYKLTILDTPGHSEFREGVYTALDAVEGVLFIIDMSKKITAASLQLYHIIQEAKLPIMAVLNKIDRVPATDFSSQVNSVCKQFEQLGGLAPLQTFNNKTIEDHFLSMSAHDSILRYDELTDGKTPAVFASAQLGVGIQELLKHIPLFVHPPSHNKHFGKMTSASIRTSNDSYAQIINHNPPQVHVHAPTSLRLYNGTLQQGDLLYTSTGEQCTVKTLLDANGKPVRRIAEGEIFFASGLDTYPTGTIVCSQPHNLTTTRARTTHPVVEAVVEAKNAASALKRVQLANPAYSMRTAEGKLVVAGPGPFSLEVLAESLRVEYGLPVNTLTPSPAYIAIPDRSSHERELVSRHMDKRAGVEVKLQLERVNTLGNTPNKLHSTHLTKSILHELEKYLESTLFFGKAPIRSVVGTIDSVKILYGSSSTSTLFLAGKKMLDTLLYETNNMILCQPGIELNILADHDEHLRIRSFFDSRGMTSFEVYDQSALRTQFGEQDHVRANKRSIVSRMSVSDFLRYETTIHKLLLNSFWHKKAEGYVVVPAGEARDLLGGSHE
jgi:small GTP-binding protein